MQDYGSQLLIRKDYIPNKGDVCCWDTNLLFIILQEAHFF